MNMDSLKKWIIAIFMSIFVIIIILITLIFLNKNMQEETDKPPEQQEEQQYYSEIQYTQYNEIYYAHISDMQLCNTYLLDYKSNAINHTEDAYNSLDKEYREKRFGSFENYKKYVQENAEKIFGIKLAKYQVKKYDDYNQYICIDQYGNYYVFNETAIMKYTLALDTYTTDLPQYVEQYNSSTKTQQVGMSIERFVNAIYDENYTFAYSVLASEFKENYFKTQEQFETYMKQNFIKSKQISYGETRTEGDIHIFTVAIGDEGSSSITKKFVVRLGEGTSFEISFEI